VNQEIVEVVEIGDGGVWVEGIQQSACGSCSARAGCGQHSLSKLGRPVRLWVESTRALQIGEHVTLELPQGSLAVSALSLYGLPLAGLIGGALLGYQGGSDLVSMLSGMLGLISGMLSARWLASRNRERWQPRILEGCRGLNSGCE